jgi:hypothetical protein
VAVSGQPKLKLNATEHDFGIFKEEAGRQTHTFMVTNTGDQPLVIQNIVASCGCTTPDWTRTPIAPGAEGKITAVYDPAKRPGAFSKTLSVYTNASSSPLLITLKGEVKGMLRTEQDYYTWQVGTLRIQGNSIAFPDVLNTEKRIRVLPVFNTSQSPVKIGFDDLPPYIEMKAVPEVLKGGQKGLIECIYYGNRSSKWGNVSDIVKLKLDGKVQPGELFILAIILEDFSVLSKADLANAPVFKPSATRFDLGQSESAISKEVEINFTNAGKRDLIIRNIWSSCNCIKVIEGRDAVVKPGESGLVRLAFSTEKLTGRISRSFYIYTNDPLFSKVAFSIQAIISPEK